MPTTLTPTPSPAPTAALAKLQVDIHPAGALVYVDGGEKGRTPLSLLVPAGVYEVRVQLDGYADWQRAIEVRPGEDLLMTAALADATPPEVKVRDLPDALQVGQSLSIAAHASDNEAVALMRLWIDGDTVAEAREPSLAYTWETGEIWAGLHEIIFEAIDATGNLGRESRHVQLAVPPTPEASPSSAATATKLPEARAHITAVTLLTYPFGPYLRERVDPKYNSRVVWLDRSAYEGSAPEPRPATFEAVVLENRYLHLTFLPDLGGRLYRCTLKATGQNIFYQNAVLKPSYWGPLSREENWWLAAGGMEWALPVHEHGYEWGLSWAYDLEQTVDGVSIAFRDKTASDGNRNDRLWAEVRVTLPEDRPYFVVEPRIENPTPEAIAFQFWLNAALTLGSASTSSNTEFILPAEQVIVHSTGDPALPGEGQALSWPLYDGRDLSRYGNWRNWLGVFVPGAQHGCAGAYNHDTGLGIVRLDTPQPLRGLKLFAFGVGFAARAEFSDDNTDYFEIWAGPCATFWPEDDVVLAPGESLGWTEIWWPFRGIAGFDRASAEVIARVTVRDGDLELGIVTSRARRARVHLDWDGGAFYQGVADLTPDRPFGVRVGLPEGASFPGELTVRVTDEGGAILLEYATGIVL